jgi:predicted ATPase
MVRALVGIDRGTRREVNLAAMGSGVSQIVPVVVQTVLTPSGGCLVVEQPEIHLHPAAQATLADLFVENLTHGRQYIIETHSEHLLLRLRRRIADRSVKPESVRVLAVERKDGWTVINQLELSQNGHFKEWPAGFFDEGYQEALALAQAQMTGRNG